MTHFWFCTGIYHLKLWKSVSKAVTFVWNENMWLRIYAGVNISEGNWTLNLWIAPILWWTNTCLFGGCWVGSCEGLEQKQISWNRSCTCKQRTTFGGRSWMESSYLWDGNFRSSLLGAHGKVRRKCWNRCFWLHLTSGASLHRCGLVLDFCKLAETRLPTCARWIRNHPTLRRKITRGSLISPQSRSVLQVWKCFYMNYWLALV